MRKGGEGCRGEKGECGLQRKERKETREGLGGSHMRCSICLSRDLVPPYGVEHGSKVADGQGSPRSLRQPTVLCKTHYAERDMKAKGKLKKM
ncbi:heat shock 22 kDa protein [Pyrus ussuriensis x Pyrus communis]|uniref:Heat shock 22 kDa protein n=1 Tax=Pyrus ussuriensis x Pyrus communis TaxID=2448454 RepID=A0A5N5GBR5_9ROSA|nr:heat shock 22 kDa protein [Pyrus ussuriensis x Pyrus communis]